MNPNIIKYGDFADCIPDVKQAEASEVPVVDTWEKVGRLGTWHFAIGRRINGRGIPAYVCRDGDSVYRSANFNRLQDGTPALFFRYSGFDHRLSVPVPDKWRHIWEDYNNPISQLNIYTIEDDRSREFLYKCAQGFEYVHFYTSMDDPGVKEDETRITLGVDIDDYFVACYKGGAEDILKRIMEAVRILQKKGAYFTCYECGKETHWLDTADNFEQLVYNLDEEYCGC
jgi:hypothetical protein